MKRPFFRWAGMIVSLILTLQPAFPALAQENGSLSALAQAKLSGFDPNDILADSDIFGLGNMTRDDVQRFLMSKGALGTIQQRDIDGKEKSIADIIWRVATSYKLNPKYLMVLLQKEQSLIEDPEPEQQQFDWAAGYGVCDSCAKDDPGIQDFKGFANQLEWAAKQHRERYLFQLLGRGTTIAGQAPGKSVFIDGLSIVPANRATAMLYSYTPHIHGNLNLWQIWQKWFSVSFPDGTVAQAQDDKTIYLIRFGMKRPFASKAIAMSMIDPEKILIVPDSQLSVYPDGQPIKFPNYSLVQTPNGTRYLIVGNKKRRIANMEAFRKFLFNSDELIDGTDEELAQYADGPAINTETLNPLGLLVKDTGGITWYLEDGVRHEIPDRTFLHLYFRGKPVKAITKTKLDAYTLGEPYRLRDGELVRTTDDPAVYVLENGKRRPIVSGEAFEALGWSWKNVVTLPKSVVEAYELGETIANASGGSKLATSNP